jgi:hypothetical protein
MARPRAISNQQKHRGPCLPDFFENPRGGLCPVKNDKGNRGLQLKVHFSYLWALVQIDVNEILDSAATPEERHNHHDITENAFIMGFRRE